MNTTMQLKELNLCPPDTFCAALASIWENAPWVARSIVAQRPFESTHTLHQAMLASIQNLQESELVQFFAGHPELGGEQARSGTMTQASTSEQGLLGFEALNANDAAVWEHYNHVYRRQFGFPFILCIRQHSMASALQAFEARLQNTRSTEIANALQEIAAITRLRLADQLDRSAS